MSLASLLYPGQMRGMTFGYCNHHATTLNYRVTVTAGLAQLSRLPGFGQLLAGFGFLRSLGECVRVKFRGSFRTLGSCFVRSYVVCNTGV